jgi:hypothetical protein
MKKKWHSRQMMSQMYSSMEITLGKLPPPITSAYSLEATTRPGNCDHEVASLRLGKNKKKEGYKKPSEPRPDRHDESFEKSKNNQQ